MCMPYATGHNHIPVWNIVSYWASEWWGITGQYPFSDPILRTTWIQLKISWHLSHSRNKVISTFRWHYLVKINWITTAKDLWAYYHALFQHPLHNRWIVDTTLTIKFISSPIKFQNSWLGPTSRRINSSSTPLSQEPVFELKTWIQKPNLVREEKAVLLSRFMLLMPFLGNISEISNW